MRSEYFGRCWEGLALFRASCVVLTVKFGDFDADSRSLEWFVPGIHGEIRLTRLRLTLFGAIGTVWRTGIAVFGLCDAAALSRCRQVVPMPPSGVDRGGVGSWLQERDPALRTPKYGHLLPTCRLRATMAT